MSVIHPPQWLASRCIARWRGAESISAAVRRVCGIVFVATLLAAAFAPSAGAALRDYTFRWLPSRSPSVQGYELTLQSFDGSTRSVFDLGLPPIGLGGVMSRSVRIDGDVSMIASLRAYGGSAVSKASNQVIVWKAPLVAPEVAPSITAVDGLTGVVAGAVVVVAQAEGPVESVSFSIDGATYRIENQPPWSIQGDAGTPGTEIAFDTTSLTDGPHVLEAIAWTSDGASGSPSAVFEVSFEVDNSTGMPSSDDPGTPGGPGPIEEPPPASPPPGDIAATVVGLYTVGDALYLLRIDGTSQLLYRYHLIGNYDPRPAWCDLDADGDRDLVLGFGPGSLSLVMLLMLDDFEVVDLQVIQGANNEYAMAWGETFPGCGDVDGDGRNELAIGMGAGSDATIHLLDDIETHWAGMPGSFRKRVITLPSASTLGFAYPLTGAAKPVLADVDGDGYDEIIVSRSEGGLGTVSIFDDTNAGYRMFFGLATSEGVLAVVTDDAYKNADGSTEVTAGDVDGDGRDEIIVATRRDGVTGVDVYDDAIGEYALLIESGVQTAPGAAGGDAALEVLLPGAADVDGDGLLEIAAGLGGGAEGAPGVQVLDDLDTGFEPFVGTGDVPGFVAAPSEAGFVWPAIEANP